jgi:hypothetical protein
MKKFIAIIFVLASLPTFAQTISPVVVECSKKCNGTFTVTNNSLQSLAVIIEPQMFGFDTQHKLEFTPVGATAKVELKETSAKLGPKESHDFDYKLRCVTFPCMVDFQASMIMGHTAEGLAIRVVLPHMVYSCDKAANCRTRVLKAAGMDVPR